ncbi:MAG: zinc ribbon domain-containing protein [Thermoproteota archaeon]|nr:zinc ribbon domain-containing protein [Thermoproteota archaeon]
MPGKKGISVWIFGFLTFLAVLHTFDAFLSFTSGETNLFLKLYHINRWFGNVDVVMYFWSSLVSAFVLFGVTSIISCHNPIMTLYDKILAEVEFAEKEVDDVMESETSLLEMINNSLTSNSVALQMVKKNLSSMKEAQEGLKAKMGRLGSKLNDLEVELTIGFKKLRTELTEREKCPSCGRNVSPGFKICPYCGEKLWYGIVQIEPVSHR